MPARPRAVCPAITVTKLPATWRWGWPELGQPAVRTREEVPGWPEKCLMGATADNLIVTSNSRMSSDLRSPT